MQLLALLQQTRPIFLLELLLSQHHLDIAIRVIDLALLGVDLRVKLQLDMVRLIARFAREGELARLQIELEIFWLHVGHRDCQVDVILGGIGGRGALSPQDYESMLVYKVGVGGVLGMLRVLPTTLFERRAQTAVARTAHCVFSDEVRPPRHPMQCGAFIQSSHSRQQRVVGEHPASNWSWLTFGSKFGGHCDVVAGVVTEVCRVEGVDIERIAVAQVGEGIQGLFGGAEGLVC